MTEKKYIVVPAAVLVFVVLFLILENLEPPANTMLWREIFNAGHAPLFGTLALVFLILSLAVFGRKFNFRLWHYITAFVLTVAAGIASELAQILGPRDADPVDFVRDIIGAVVFLGLYLTFDKKALDAFPSRFREKLPGLRLFLGVIFVLSFLSVFLMVGAYFERNYIFPKICTFDTFGLTYFVETHNAELESVPPPAAWKNHDDGRVARVTYRKATYPDIEINEPFPNWSGYDSLTFEVFSPNDTTIRLTLRIEDARHNNRRDDRFTETFEVPPGFNEISIPLDRVRRAPAGRLLDMRNIYAIHLFAYKIEHPLTVYLDNFRMR